jgi:hypothetical protein
MALRRTLSRLALLIVATASSPLLAAGLEAEPTADAGAAGSAGQIQLRGDEVRRSEVRQAADLRLPGGSRIRAIYQKSGVAVPTRDSARPVRPSTRRMQVAPSLTTALGDAAPATGEVMAYVIDSPPIDGFVPWVAVSVTDRHKFDEWTATSATSVSGNYLVPSPPVPYGIGVLDTGAGVSAISYALAEQLGIFSADLQHRWNDRHRGRDRRRRGLGQPAARPVDGRTGKHQPRFDAQHRRHGRRMERVDRDGRRAGSRHA